MAANAHPVPTTVHSNGMVVATGLPQQSSGHVQNLQGGLLQHAVDKTASSMRAQASHAKAAGVTMRGSGRVKKGGAVIQVPRVAEGGTIPGVSFTANHASLIGGLNQLRASSVYDNLAGTQPYKIGGRRRTRHRNRHRRIPDDRIPVEEPVVTAGGKHRRKTKRHGRSSHKRNSVGKFHRRIRRSRRSTRRNK